MSDAQQYPSTTTHFDAHGQLVVLETSVYDPLLAVDTAGFDQTADTLREIRDAVAASNPHLEPITIADALEMLETSPRQDVRTAASRLLDVTVEFAVDLGFERDEAQ